MSQVMELFAEYGADIKGIRERFIDDEELMIYCMEQFVKEEGFHELGASLEKKNYAQAFEYVHALKGVSGNLGLMPLYQVISDLVEELRMNRYEEVDELYLKVMEERDKFIAVFNKSTK